MSYCVCVKKHVHELVLCMHAPLRFVRSCFVVFIAVCRLKSLCFVVAEKCMVTWLWRMCVYTSYACPCTHHTHVRAHIIRMFVHTSCACPCTHTHARSHIVRSNARNTHTRIHAVIAYFSFCGGKFILCCGGSLWCCVCTHHTHVRAHILRMPVHTSYACPLTYRTLQHTHTRKHACKDTFLPAYLHPHA